MGSEFKLIYIGILKFGFKYDKKISIVGLINYIRENNLDLEESPEISVNRNYAHNGDEWFWELEWWNLLDNGVHRCLVVYFDKCGCHYIRFFDTTGPGGYEECGNIIKYDEFLEQFRWLSGKPK